MTITTGSLVEVKTRAGISIDKWHFIPEFGMGNLQCNPEDFITVWEPFTALYICSTYVTKRIVKNKKTRRSGRKGRHVQTTKNTLWHLLTWGSERYWVSAEYVSLTVLTHGDAL